MTNRGRFRKMNMDDLQASRTLPLWDDEETATTYALPLQLSAPSKPELWQDFPDDQLFRIGPFICSRSPQSHIGLFRWAIDFLVLDGAPVFAAREGTVIEIKEGFERWGDGPEFRDDLNFVTIQHAGGEFSQYCHLAKGSVRQSGIRQGTWVRKEQQIGIVGKTGWTDRDHLHFIVFRGDGRKENPFGFKSLRPRFE